MFKKAILSALVSAALVAPALAESIVGYNGSTPGVFQPQNKLFIPGNKPLLPRLPSGSLKPACPDLAVNISCLLYTSPSPRDATLSRMPSSA